MARKFLYVVAFLIVLAIAATFAYRLFGNEFMKLALVPSTQFETVPAPVTGSYAKSDMWLARPDKPNNPAQWLPKGVERPAKVGAAAIFFVHPTSYMDKAHWNASLDNKEANGNAVLFLRGQASAFNAVGDVWAPRYRQATFGAFLTSEAAAGQALDAAYRDVDAAFTEFLKHVGDRPIILAGHSQGSLHLTRLLKERAAGTPLAKRIVATYAVGWPISRTADLPALGLPECAKPDQTGCILSWQSFGEPADPSLISDAFDASLGLTGQPRKGSAMVCTNPLTGAVGGQAPASANLGTLFPSDDLATATLKTGRVGARCFGRGFLSIGDGPPMPRYVMLGQNYHVFDYSLFWGNVRADAARRLAAFSAK